MTTSAARPSPGNGVRGEPRRSGEQPLPRPAAELAAAAWEEAVRSPRRAAEAYAIVVGVARRMVRGGPGEPALPDRTPELEEPLARLCIGIRDALDGRAPRLPDLQALVRMRPLLDRVRAGVLQRGEELATMEDGRALLLVLRAIEAVQQVLADDGAQRLAARLGEADALDLVVEVAHDIRSPLSSILFLSERLRRGQSGPVNPVQERQLGLMYSAAFGLSTLASDVMELARGGDRLVSQQPLPFSLQEVLGSVRDVVQPMAEEKGLALTVECAIGDWRVGHAQALNRVLLNLVTNALKFTNEGQVTLRVQPAARTRVEFSVEDTGRGIPPHVLATLFDAFRRRQSPGDYAFSSAGLGLSICRKLILALGGELRVETELERGTRFRFDVDLPPMRRF